MVSSVLFTNLLRIINNKLYFLLFKEDVINICTDYFHLQLCKIEGNWAKLCKIFKYFHFKHSLQQTRNKIQTPSGGNPSG